MVLSKQETLDTIRSELRSIWPYKRLQEYSKSIFEEVMSYVRECLFSKTSTKSLLGGIRVRFFDKNKRVLFLTILWSRIDLPKSRFVGNVHVEINDDGPLDDFYKSYTKSDEPHIFYKHFLDGRNIVLWELSRPDGKETFPSGMDRWFNYRKSTRRFRDLFKKLHLDISCLEDKDVAMVSFNLKIPAILIRHNSNHYIILDNRQNKVPCFVSTFTDIRNKYLKSLKKNFPFFTKEQLSSFLVLAAMNRDSGFLPKCDNYFREKYLLR